MCLLAVCETNTLPEENFRSAFKTNDDGFGFAFRKKGKVNYFKGMMDVDEAWKIYNGFSKSPIFPHVIHFRLGSPTTELLTHPFEITIESELNVSNVTTNDVLFHNGVITCWKDKMWDMFAMTGKIPEGPIIDTRVAAILCAKLGERVFEFIDGKFVIFGPEKLVYIGKFEDPDKNVPGIVFSNTSYKVSKSTTYYSNGYQYPYQNNGYNRQQGSLLFDKKDLDEFIDEFVI